MSNDYKPTPGFSPNWTPGDPPEEDEDFTPEDVEEEFPNTV